MSEGHAESRAIQLREAGTATRYPGNACARAILRALSESMALPQPGSMAMSISPDTIEGYDDAMFLDCHLVPRWCLRMGEHRNL